MIKFKVGDIVVSLKTHELNGFYYGNRQIIKGKKYIITSISQPTSSGEIFLRFFNHDLGWNSNTFKLVTETKQIKEYGIVNFCKTYYNKKENNYDST